MEQPKLVAEKLGPQLGGKRALHLLEIADCCLVLLEGSLGLLVGFGDARQNVVRNMRQRQCVQ